MRWLSGEKIGLTANGSLHRCSHNVSSRRATDSALVGLLSELSYVGRTMKYYQDMENTIASLTPQQVTDAAREWLALNGFDPVYGARPLRRLVQSAIGDQLAKALLAGEIRDGDQVLVDWAADVAEGDPGLTVNRG